MQHDWKVSCVMALCLSVPSDSMTLTIIHSLYASRGVSYRHIPLLIRCGPEDSAGILRVVFYAHIRKQHTKSVKFLCAGDIVRRLRCQRTMISISFGAPLCRNGLK